jgi:hypothetical protein
MKLTLDYARIAVWDMQDTVDGEQVKVRLYHPMTLADLVEIGEGLGGEVQATSIVNVSDVPLRVLTIGGPSGRYLVIPLGEHEPEG